MMQHVAKRCNPARCTALQQRPHEAEQALLHARIRALEEANEKLLLQVAAGELAAKEAAASVPAGLIRRL
jgi:hypothetical protein